MNKSIPEKTIETLALVFEIFLNEVFECFENVNTF